MNYAKTSSINNEGLHNEAIIGEGNDMPEKQASAMPKITALYSRTATFKLDAEINSIKHQKEVIEGYAKKNGFTNLHHFSDEGVSGISFDRKGWNAVLEKIEAGRVATIIVENTSRVGRDIFQVPSCIETLIREKDIRFISVADNIDSATDSICFAAFREFSEARRKFVELAVRQLMLSRCLMSQQKRSAMNARTVNRI